MPSARIDVRFMVRPPRAESLARQGLVITGPPGDLRVPVTVLTAVDSPFDAVLLACKAYDPEGAMEAIAPAVGPSTLIVPLLNGVRQLDVLDARFGRERALGGLCQHGDADARARQRDSGDEQRRSDHAYEARRRVTLSDEA
ncbi:MAG: 2-dehydropantoate 2-reductase N-terminal domain-containing protein [Burkholderiaceae bacterium]